MFRLRLTTFCLIALHALALFDLAEGGGMFHEFTPPVLCLLGMLHAGILGWGVARRLEANASTALRVGGVLALVQSSIWWFPLLGAPGAESLLLTTVFFGMIQAVLVTAMLGKVGEYLYTDRPFPELEGEALPVARETLERARLTPLSFRTAAFPWFNAMVQGFGKCLVVVDRRASESLEPGELSALIGHECGHVRRGGVLPYLAAFPAVLLLLQTVTALGVWTPTIIGALALGLFALRAIGHHLEYRCDRFAAQLTSEETTRTMLRRIHADFPTRIHRWVDHAFFGPVGSHPILSSRLAALGEPIPGVHRRVRLGWVAAASLVLTPPLVGLTVGPPPGWAGLALAHGLPTLFCLWLIALQVVLSVEVQRVHLPSRSGKLAFGRFFLWIAIGLVCLGISSVNGEPLPLALAALSVGVALLELFGRRRRTRFHALPAVVRSAVVAASAAQEEGRPDEALAILGELPEKHRDNPWVLALRSSALIGLDDLETAQHVLDALPEEHDDFLPALLARLSLALCRNVVDRSSEIAARLRDEHASVDKVLFLTGVAALVAGSPSLAAEDFRRATELKGEDARALAGLAIALLESGETLDEVAPLLERAERAERTNPFVRLATARGHLARGQEEEARHAFEESLGLLVERGWLGWRHLNLRWAERWGIETPAESRIGRSQG